MMFRRAFTLIELLIVVAIIAILAAIAVPNFLEAQTRAKVSRVKSDERALATAIESYAVDNNHYPFDVAKDVNFPYYLSPGLSTPIAYISSAATFHDVFTELGGQLTFNPNDVQKRYRFRAFSELWVTSQYAAAFGFNLPGPTAPGNVRAQEVHGKWFMVSKGPDRVLNTLPTGFADGANVNDWFWQVYDPTNGTISAGEVMRAQSGVVNGYTFPVPYP